MKDLALGSVQPELTSIVTPKSQITLGFFGGASAPLRESFFVVEVEGEDEEGLLPSRFSSVTSGLPLCFRTRELVAIRSLYSLLMRLQVTVTNPLRSLTMAVLVESNSARAALISAEVQRQGRQICSTVPVTCPQRPSSCMAQSRSTQIPRVLGEHIDSCGSFNQSPV